MRKLKHEGVKVIVQSQELISSRLAVAVDFPKARLLLYLLQHSIVLTWKRWFF